MPPNPSPPATCASSMRRITSTPASSSTAPSPSASSPPAAPLPHRPPHPCQHQRPKSNRRSAVTPARGKSRASRFRVKPATCPLHPPRAPASPTTHPPQVSRPRVRPATRPVQLPRSSVSAARCPVRRSRSRAMPATCPVQPSRRSVREAARPLQASSRAVRAAGGPLQLSRCSASQFSRSQLPQPSSRSTLPGLSAPLPALQHSPPYPFTLLPWATRQTDLGSMHRAVLHRSCDGRGAILRMEGAQHGLRSVMHGSFLAAFLARWRPSCSSRPSSG